MCFNFKKRVMFFFLSPPSLNFSFLAFIYFLPLFRWHAFAVFSSPLLFLVLKLFHDHKNAILL